MCVKAGEREQRERERETERISIRIRAVNAEPDAGLSPTILDHEVG